MILIYVFDVYLFVCIHASRKKVGLGEMFPHVWGKVL